MTDIIISVIDDDVLTIKIIQHSLHDYGENIRFFTDVNEFLDDFHKNSNVKILVIDYYLGNGVLGIDILKMITKDPRITATIVMSSNASLDDAIELFHNKLFRFVNKTKPNYLDKLEGYIYEAKEEVYKEEKIKRDTEEFIQHLQSLIKNKDS